MRVMRHGFTLLEMLVVVTIVAIAATAAIPMMSSSTASTGLAGATRGVAADVIWAQSQAVTTQQSVYVVFSKGSAGRPDQYAIQTMSSGGTLTNMTGTPGPNPVTLGPATTTVTAAQLNMGSITIKFDPRGQPYVSATSGDTAVYPAQAILLKSTKGNYTSQFSIQPFTGGITIP